MITPPRRLTAAARAARAIVAAALFLLALEQTASATCQTDTTKADFRGGVATNVDVAGPGDVVLAKGALDQQQTVVSTSGTGFNTTQWLGQTFVPATSGPLDKIDISMFCASCSGTDRDITVEIRTTTGSPALPTSTVLATTTIVGFSAGTANTYNAYFDTPANVTAGVTYAFTLRLVINRTGTYAAFFGNAPTDYPNGNRVVTMNSGGTWTVPTSTGIARDLVFKTYVGNDFALSGDFVSAVKDANPPSGSIPVWTSLAWTAATPTNTALGFQVAASSNAAGPFNFVGPDNTAGTFFANGASLSQFNGNRYLKYKAFFSTASNTVSPTLNDVTVCFDNVTNLAPTFTSAASATFVVGSAGTFTIQTLGLPAPALSQTAGTLPSGVTFVDNGDGTATLSGTPAAGTGGTYPITFTAANGNAPDATQNFTLTVNQAPAITSANAIIFTIGANNSFSVTATGLPSPTFGESGTLPAGVTFTPATGVLSGIPAAGTAGTYPITFTASNGVGTDATQNFTLIINTPPVAGTDSFGTLKNTPLQVSLATLLANDSDADSDTLSIISVGASSTQGGSVVLGSTAITYTPPDNFVGQDTFTYTLSDGRGGLADGSVTVNVGATSTFIAVSITKTATDVVLQFAGIPGQSYIIQAASTAGGPYTDFAGPITAGNDGSFTYHDTTQPQPDERFYRARSNP